MLNRTDQYALQVLAHLCRHPEKRLQGLELAKATGISWSYLSKILSRLRKKGFVSAKKGWGGGFKLAAKTFNQPIYDVLVAVGGNPSVPTACLFGWPKCGGSNPCPLHWRWAKISGLYLDMLKKTTIAMLGR